MWRASAFMIALFATPAPANPSDREIVVDGPAVHFSDIFDMNRIPAALRERAAEIRLAMVPADHAGESVALAWFAARARRQIPALGPSLSGIDGSVRIRRRPDPTGTVADHPRETVRSCVRIERPFDRGAVVPSGALAAVPCDDDSAYGVFRYDLSVGAVRAVRALSPGDVAVAPGSMPFADIVPGQPLVVAVRIGHVQVRRDAVAVQPAQWDDRFFARTADNHLIPVTIPSEVAQ